MIWIVFLGFLSLLLLAGGVALGLYGWHNSRRASQLECPLSRIGKLKPGFRKIRGTVAAVGTPLNSPVSNKACVYYRLRVYEDKKTYKEKPTLPAGVFTAFFLFGALGALLYRTYEVGADDTRAEHSRRSLLDEESDVLSLVEDDTGGVEVDLRRATILSKEKARIVTDINHPPPSHLEELLREEYDIDTVDRRGGFKTLHFIEDVLLVGAKVIVVGPVEQLKSGDLRFEKGDAPFLVCERNMSKEIKAARSGALGCIIGSASSLAVGLCCLLGFIFLVASALRAH
ncbi:MAG TPA: GIDE domain-containing protein [Gemmataceae bacterium]|nr:GIDE domain-containing protein [Gemmataceae bacterium]